VGEGAGAEEGEDQRAGQAGGAGHETAGVLAFGVMEWAEGFSVESG